LMQACVDVAFPYAHLREAFGKKIGEHQVSTSHYSYLFAPLALCLSVCLSACLPICLSVCLPICLSVCLPACLSVCLSACLSVCLPACLSVCLPVCRLPICLSVCLWYLAVSPSVRLAPSWFSFQPSLYVYLASF